MKEADEILDSYDKGDADVVKELIPLFFKDSWDEFMKSFHPFLGDSTKHPDFQFILADRVEYYLTEKDFELDIDIICDIVEQHYGTF